ncbi:MAG TPA: hypothetical protein VGB78_08460 [Thermoplasmata archaeon]
MAERKEVVLMMFSKKDTESAILSTGRKVLKGEIVDADGRISNCRKCGRKLTVENLGRILPGSIDLYCDNPICFNEFSVKLV